MIAEVINNVPRETLTKINLEKLLFFKIYK